MKGRKRGKGRGMPLATMGFESEADKERNGQPPAGKKTDRAGEREKGEEGCVERGDKGAWKRSWQRCPVDRRVGPARHGNVAKRLL